MWYCGGSEQTFENDLYSKTAGSMADNNIRVFHADIDPANLPSPTDSIWNEVTNQTLINKLKEQNSDQTIETATNTFESNIYYHNAPTDGSMSVKLEGSTLKNEVANGNFADGTSGWSGTNATLTASNNVLSVIGNGVSNVPLVDKSTNINLINTNQKIYVSAYIKITNSNCSSATIQLRYSGGSFLTYSISNPIINQTYKISQITSNNGGTGNMSIRIYHQYPDSATANGKVMEVKDVICLDLTALGLESKTVAELDLMTQTYFDGIKSVGENAGGEGIHKIEVLSKGKNLAPPIPQDINGFGQNAYFTVEPKQGDYYVFKGVVNNYGFGIYKIPSTLEPNTDYDIIVEGYKDSGAYGAIRLHVEPINTSLALKEIGFNTSNGIVKSTFNSSIYKNLYIRLYPTSDTSTQDKMYIKTIMIKKSTSNDTYEPYKSDKIDILPTLPLRSLPNGVRDSISSGGVVTKRIGKVVLGGSEVITLHSTKNNTMMFRCPTTYNVKPNPTSFANILSDKFTYVDFSTMYNSADGIECICPHDSYTQAIIYISIEKSKLATQDVAGFQAWLASNPTTVYYELATPTTEKVNPLLLQSFKNGTLEVDSDIPSKTTETHNTDINDYSVLSMSCSEVGKSKALLISTTMQNIINALYGGSVTAFRSAFKKLKGNIWSSKANIKTWNGAWVSNVSNANSNISNTNYEMTDNTVIRDDNNVYIMCCAGDSAIVGTPSILNVDYIDIKTDLSRTADIIAPIPVELGNEWSILLKGISLANTDTNNKSIINIGIADNRFSFYRRGDSNELRIWENFNNVFQSATVASNSIDKFKTINILLSKKDGNIYATLCKNNDSTIYTTSMPTALPDGLNYLSIGRTSTYLEYADSFLDNIYFFNNKTFSDEEAEVILKGRNTIVGKETDTTLNELADMFKNPLIPTGYILPNNRYAIEGQASLYCNGYFTRTVQDCEFTTNQWENKIELVEGAEVRRLD